MIQERKTIIEKNKIYYFKLFLKLWHFTSSFNLLNYTFMKAIGEGNKERNECA